MLGGGLQLSDDLSHPEEFSEPVTSRLMRPS
jgi:hypothetical protein